MGRCLRKFLGERGPLNQEEGTVESGVSQLSAVHRELGWGRGDAIRLPQIECLGKEPGSYPKDTPRQVTTLTGHCSTVWVD